MKNDLTPEEITKKHEAFLSSLTEEDLKRYQSEIEDMEKEVKKRKEIMEAPFRKAVESMSMRKEEARQKAKQIEDEDPILLQIIVLVAMIFFTYFTYSKGRLMEMIIGLIAVLFMINSTFFTSKR